MIDRASALIREVGRAEVMPRFRQLEAGDVEEKSPGDLVTIADRECERVLASGLRQIRDIPVVGEEATAADPTLIDAIDASPAVWIVDPIDGTSNFVNGSTDFAVMVALVENGETTAAWVWHPSTDVMVSAERGAGTWRDGQRLTRQPTERPRGVRGIVKRKYVPEPAKSRLAASVEPLDLAANLGCAGVEYLALIDGEIDFLFYWRTLPWDHAPGTLLAIEAGLRASRPAGDPWRPGETTPGLLTATSSAWPGVAASISAALGED